MAFTFLGTLATDLDRIRFHADDTQDPGQFSDAILSALLTDRGTWQGAVADVWRRRAGQIAAKGRDFSAGDQSQTESPYYDHCIAQADAWDLRAAAEESPSSTLPLVEVVGLGSYPQDPFYDRTVT